MDKNDALSSGYIDSSSPSGEKPAIGSSGWWMVAVLFLLNAFAQLDRFILSMLVEPLKADFHLTDLQVGVILGPAFAISYTLFAIPMGWLADRFSRRATVFLGAVVWAISAAATGLVRSFELLIACRVGVGVGEASLAPCAFSLMRSKIPPHRLTTAMSVYHTGSQIGTSGAFVFGGMLIAFATALGEIHGPLGIVLAPWQFVLVVSGLPVAFIAALVFTFQVPTRQSEALKETHRTDENIFGFFWHNWRLFLPMFAGTALVALLAFSLVAWIPTYISRAFHWSPGQYGPLLGSVTFGTGLLMVLKGWFVDYLWSKGYKDASMRFFSWLIIASSPLIVFMFLTNHPIAFFVAYGLVWLMIGSSLVYVASTLQLVVPGRLRAQSVSVFMAVVGIVGSGVGPFITGAITDLVFGDQNKLGFSFLLISVVCLPIGLILVRIALPHIRQMVAQQTEGLT